MTEVEQVPTTNGLPEEAEEEDKSKLRPPDIDADMREMEKRKRVEMIMSSRLFREELERIIESQMKEGGGPAGLLQQIQDMVGGASRLQANLFRGSNCVLPINDIRGVEAMGYAKGEKVLRCKLASIFRLMDLYGWSHGIHNLITGRLTQENEEFLVNPHGLMYHEITASSLVKVDMQGNVIEKGTTNFGVNSLAFRLHAALHAARPDIKCVVHVRNPPVLAISSLKCGLIPISAESAVIGEVSCHQYIGSAAEPEERDKIARSLGPVNKVLLLSNHGALCCGETIEEAFFNVYNTVLACETQVKLMPLGIDNLISLPDEGRKSLYDNAHRAPPNDKKWRVGGLEFEALMRMLDNAGFRTGYIYRSPLVKGDPPKPKNDVEVPPAVSSLGYLLEEEEMYRQGNWKKGGVNRSDRSRWLNSPNVYQKVEILETGTNDPKKITKWVADGSPAHTSTPVKIDAALQFVPKNTNPKEFKKLQQQIKENRRADKITSGPQSHILEGVTWEEAKKLQDANISMTGDQVILVGAASKGIIQRGFQNNATVYKSPYAKNPFDQVSEQELEEYKSVVTRKQKGEYYADDTEQSESEALTSSAALIKSEQEDAPEPQVLRIETKTAPAPSQAEVVLSDDDLPDPHVARSKSQRYPAEKVPDLKRSLSADRAMADGGVGVVKCRLIDSKSLTSQKSVSKTLEMKAVQEHSPCNLDLSESQTNVFDSPDIIKTNIQNFCSVNKSKIIKDLEDLFKKRLARSYIAETIISLPDIKKNEFISNSPDFSSDGTDDTSLEIEDPKNENVKKSIGSLQEYIGEDFEGPNIDWTDLTKSELSMKNENTDFSYEKANSNEYLLPESPPSICSLVAEQDKSSVRTYISDCENISLIGLDDKTSSDSEEEDNFFIESLENSHNQKSKDHFKMQAEISIDVKHHSNRKIFKKVVISLTKENNPKLEEISKSYSALSSTESSSLENISNFNKTNNFDSNIVDPIFVTNSVIVDNKNYLDINQNKANLPDTYTSSSDCSLTVAGGYDEAEGYEADVDKTIYSNISFSSINFDDSLISTSGYDADTEELVTSFSKMTNALYTIHEE